MQLKRCTSCGTEHPEALYYWRNEIKGVRHSQCPDCLKARTLRWRLNNMERHRQTLRKNYRDSEAGQRARRKGWGSRHAGIKAWISALKTENPCQDCGKYYRPCAMDLDHVRGEKLMNLGSITGMALSDDLILEEIQKCELVCANCHRVRTWNRNQARKAAKAA